ncbi:MAG: M20 family metallo-hydrolase [Chitinophagaceae bacterium]|nr:M20 family metallo-hydrolase [Chitinophagaceae bacterium]
MNNSDLNKLHKDAIDLLKELIATPSFSGQEDQTAGIISRFLAVKGLETTRVGNNVFSLNKNFDSSKKTILLNSHHDTVKPNSQYTRDPFSPAIEDRKLYGLGSNDAGGALVSLIAAFLYYWSKENLKYNLVLAATAEEEISGKNGIESLLQSVYFIEAVKENKEHPFRGWGCIVGEPTNMQMAVAEKGLLVLDCVACGKAAHAARDEGENAIYRAVADINCFRNYQFEKVSDLLGPVKMTVTSIETENKSHNIIPAQCKYDVDVRVNELYTLEEVVQTVQANVQSRVTPRSLRLRPTFVSLDHPLVKAGLAVGRNYFGSPTTSDKALMSFPALKMGPGDSSRSHIADEFIFIDEIMEGIEIYIQLLNQLL